VCHVPGERLVVAGFGDGEQTPGGDLGANFLGHEIPQALARVHFLTERQAHRDSQDGPSLPPARDSNLVRFERSETLGQTLR
jgi:hypothetical protein